MFAATATTAARDHKLEEYRYKLRRMHSDLISAFEILAEKDMQINNTTHEIEVCRKTIETQAQQISDLKFQLANEKNSTFIKCICVLLVVFILAWLQS